MAIEHHYRGRRGLEITLIFLTEVSVPPCRAACQVNAVHLDSFAGQALKKAPAARA